MPCKEETLLDLLEVAISMEIDDIAFDIIEELHDIIDKRKPWWQKESDVDLSVKNPREELRPEQYKDIFVLTSDEMDEAAAALKLPQLMKTDNGIKFSGVRGLEVVVARLRERDALKSLMTLFGGESTRLSRIFNTTVTWLSDEWSCKLLKRLSPFKHRFNTYSEAFQRKGEEHIEKCQKRVHMYPPHVIGVIDGSEVQIMKPDDEEIQVGVYSGYKKQSSIKFHHIIAPDGLIMHMSDVYGGPTNDITIYQQSMIDEELDDIEESEGMQCTYLILGDPAYSTGGHLISGYKHYESMPLTVPQSHFNNTLSITRQCVEWNFGTLKYIFFPLLNTHARLKLGQQNLSGILHVASVLSNVFTCIKGASQASEYFDVQVPTLTEYLSFFD